MPLRDAGQPYSYSGSGRFWSTPGVLSFHSWSQPRRLHFVPRSGLFSTVASICLRPRNAYSALRRLGQARRYR